MLDFKIYAVASKYAVQINDGYSSRLTHGEDMGRSLISCCADLNGDEQAAFIHGWNMADRDEGRRK